MGFIFKKANEALKMFTEQLHEKGVQITEITEDGFLIVEHDGATLTINFENIQRNYLRTKDPQIISDFVEQVMSAFKPFPEWEIAKDHLLMLAEPEDSDLEHIVCVQVTDTICKVLEYFDEDGGRLIWLNESQLARWNVTREEALEAAALNMAKLMEETKIRTSEVQGMKLGMFSTAIAEFKASLIFAPNFKEKVAETIGWPVFAVLPTRDFIYVFAEKDQNLIHKIGPVVIEEYTQAGYPLSKDVFHISDVGILSIAGFSYSDVELPEDGAPLQKAPVEGTPAPDDTQH